MSTESKTCCDHCGKQLNEETNYPHTYGVRLSSHDYKPRNAAGGAVLSVAMYPQIEKNYDFCGLECLRGWLTK